TELETVGGKGANLGRLTQAGFEVPTGFTVTTDAYAEFIEKTGLATEIDRMLGEADFGDSEGLEKLTAALRDAITSAEMPSELAKTISCAYTGLGDEPSVATRSSATAEVLPGASYAGLHDTYLDIRGRDEVCDAVQRCWASLWTARATAYR